MIICGPEGISGPHMHGQAETSLSGRDCPNHGVHQTIVATHELIQTGWAARLRLYEQRDLVSANRIPSFALVPSQLHLRIEMPLVFHQSPKEPLPLTHHLLLTMFEGNSRPIYRFAFPSFPRFAQYGSRWYNRGGHFSAFASHAPSRCPKQGNSGRWAVPLFRPNHSVKKG